MAGDVVQVKSGYARNYLLPYGYAVPVKAGDEDKIKHHQKILQKRIEEEKSEFLNLKKELDKVVLTFIKKTVEDQKKIFGAITALEISQSLAKENFSIEKKFIILKKPIKEVGEHTCDIVLSKEVTAQIKIQVLPEILPEEDAKEAPKKKATKKVSKKKSEA